MLQLSHQGGFCRHHHRYLPTSDDDSLLQNHGAVSTRHKMDPRPRHAAINKATSTPQGSQWVAPLSGKAHRQATTNRSVPGSSLAVFNGHTADWLSVKDTTADQPGGAQTNPTQAGCHPGEIRSASCHRRRMVLPATSAALPPSRLLRVVRHTTPCLTAYSSRRRARSLPCAPAPTSAACSAV